MIAAAIVLVLISVNALYVAAEFSAVGVRHGQIRARADGGNTFAKLLLPVIDDPALLDRYIAACQIGITFSSLVLGAYGQVAFSRDLHLLILDMGWMGVAAAGTTAAMVVLVTLTALQVVFGELIPKSLALQFPVSTALWTVLPMRWSLVLFAWFVKVLNGSGNLLLRMFGHSPTGHRHIHSPEEIEMLIAESRDGGLLEEDEQERLHQALRLSLKTTHQLMVPRTRMVALDIEAPIDEAIKKLVDSPYSRLPVYRTSVDNVLGTVRIKDLVSRIAREGPLTSLEEVLTPATIVPETISADRLLAVLRERHAQQAIVVDEHGTLAGLVTLEDIFTELFGAVSDEFKQTVPPEPERLPDGRLRLRGRMRLDRVETELELPWRGRSDTVGGYLIEQLGYYPAAGETVRIDGVEITIEAVRDFVIQSVLITPPASASEADEGAAQ